MSEDFSRLAWYLRRVGRMSPGEIAWRVREQALRRAWSRRQVRPDQVAELPPPTAGTPRFVSVLPAGAASAVPEEAKAAILTDADRIMAGRMGDARRRPQ